MRCHGLVPWSLPFAATQTSPTTGLDATGLSRGASRLLLLKPVQPRGQAVASRVGVAMSATDKRVALLRLFLRRVRIGALVDR